MAQAKFIFSLQQVVGPIDRIPISLCAQRYATSVMRCHHCAIGYADLCSSGKERTRRHSREGAAEFGWKEHKKDLWICRKTSAMW